MSYYNTIEEKKQVFFVNKFKKMKFFILFGNKQVIKYLF